MVFPVAVQNKEGRFIASLVGDSSLHAERDTAEAAVRALETALQERVTRGELWEARIHPRGLLEMAGTYKDDPDLLEICAEAYRERDRDRAAWEARQ